MIKIRNLMFGDGVPKVATIIDKPLSMQTVQNYINSGADFFEVRGDCFNTSSKEFANFVAKLRKNFNTPLLATIKENDNTKRNRIKLYESILDDIDLVDTDISTSDKKDIIQLASQKTKIISFHDFDKTPENSELTDISNEAFDIGADIVKIATMINSADDAIRLLNFTHNLNKPIVSIGMGSLGVFTRVMAPLYGSLFTFAFVGEAVAPGQIPLNDMVLQLKKFYPNY